MNPRSAGELIRDALDLYGRFPLLFLTLGAGVIVPYEVIVLIATGAGPFTHESLSVGVSYLLTLIELAFLGPLVSALHVHAVRMVKAGETPRLGPVALQGLKVLPVVAATAIISWLGIFLGLLLLIVPGVILWLRWYVAAQAAAIENEGWLPALRRSRALTAGNYRHLVAFAILVGLLTAVPTALVSLAFDRNDTTAASFVVGVALQVVTWSFAALASGLLYFDLRGRLEPPAVDRPGDGQIFEDAV